VGPSIPERRSPGADNARERESVRRLKAAMAEGRLILKYQPIVSAGDLRPVAAEALLRWRTPRSESDGLGELLAAAERSPVIFDLETWAMDVCFREAASWPAVPSSALRVNLNLSARDVQTGDLMARLEAALAASGLDPRRLTLEITETSAIHAPDDVVRVIERIKAIGPQLWLDDFGTGHSSLAWLSWFPIDGLKVPGMFVDRLPGDRRCVEIVSSVIAMAQRLGLRVVAEGVETEAQLSFLKECHCDDLQGFLLRPPLTSAELADWLRAG
jgi:EAL domain-containing protein (putative c-di-GMP-specific phosphodiesterase class I)